MEALNEFDLRGGKRIVEIGSMRQPMKHSIDIVMDCCMDGHSSALLARAAKEFWTVDADPEATFACSRELIRLGFGDAMVVCGGGIQFLTFFQQPIDMLFLDGWDCDLPQCASEHLRAYSAAKYNLHDKSLILIDDTDVDGGGKGRLVVPAAIEDGWKVVFDGRQTLLSK